MLFFFLLFLKFLSLMILVLMSVAFSTLLERKVLGLIGFRLGPNKVSLQGVLQPLSDALKLANKQVNYLSNSSLVFYYSSSFFMLFSSFILWSSLFSEPSVCSYKFSLLVSFMALGFNSFNSILSGWSTFSKFSLIGSIRTVSQLISYEAVLYVILFFFIFVYGTFSFYSLKFSSLFFPLLISPLFLYIWAPTVLAELNRSPFDFSEGESELVSGYNTEFGSSCFTMIFLSEYSNIVFFSLLSSYLFFEASQLYSFLFYFLFILVFIIWVRSVLPRLRYDKLMYLAWKFYIPLVTFMFSFYILFSY